MRAAPGALALEQRGDDAEREIEAADEVAERAAAAHRRPVREARHRHEPARRLRDDVVGGLRRRAARSAPKPESAATTQRGLRAWITSGAEALRAPASRRGSSRPRASARSTRRRKSSRPSGLRTSSVISACRGSCSGTRARSGPSATGRSGSRRRCRAARLDDVGAEVGEHRGRERPRDDAREVEDAQPSRTRPGMAAQHYCRSAAPRCARFGACGGFWRRRSRCATGSSTRAARTRGAP